MKTAEYYMDNEPLDDDENPYFSAGMVESIIKKVQLEAIEETVKACAEAARIKTGQHPDSQYDPRPVFTYEVDKQSILNVEEQLKAKL